jgi:hypothetical protein
MRWLSVVFLASTLLAADDPKPDFTVTAEAIAREFKADRKAAVARYHKKVVDVTGPFHTARMDSDGKPMDLLLFGFQDGVSPVFVSCTPTRYDASLYQNLQALARGQAVTVRGVVGDSSVAVLGDCRLVKVGPSTAVPVTVSKLKAMFVKPADAKKNDGKAVIARVRVVRVEGEKGRVTFTVADPMTRTTGTTTKVFVDTWFSVARRNELEAVKPGQVVIVLGVADGLAGEPRFWDAVILKTPPEGVKLPGGK